MLRNRLPLYLLSLILLLCVLPCNAGNKEKDGAEGKRIFDKVYNLVFGPEGSKFSYSVDLIGVYKTAGHITYKGKKLYYEEKRYASWNNGVVAYDVDKEKKEVNMFSASNPNKDKYMSKFKYDLNDFEYSYKEISDNRYEVTAKLKRSKFFGVRSLVAIVDRNTFYPSTLKVKVAFFTASINIKNFKPGNVDDTAFNFPSERFKTYKLNDKR